jgi:hypothetical protein
MGGDELMRAEPMRSSRLVAAGCRLGLCLGFLLLVQGGVPSGSQVPRIPGGSLGQQAGPLSGDGSDDNPVEQQKRLKALNVERQKSMIADTNKLVKLAGELNAELAGAHAESLNPDQLRKVAEIEKLARNIKEKMSMSVRGIPVFEPLPVTAR